MNQTEVLLHISAKVERTIMDDTLREIPRKPKLYMRRHLITMTGNKNMNEITWVDFERSSRPRKPRKGKLYEVRYGYREIAAGRRIRNC